MDPGIVLRGLLAGGLSALLLIPLVVGWLPTRLVDDWRAAAPLSACLILVLFSLVPPIWAGSRASRGAASSRDAWLRGAWAGAMAGVPVFLLAGAPAAGILGSAPAIAALPDAPLVGQALGAMILQGLEQIFLLTTLAWALAPTLGAALGALGAGREGREAGERRAPTLASLEATCVLVVVQIQCGLVLVGAGAALGELADQIHEHQTMQAAAGEPGVASWVTLLPFWAALLCGCLCLIGVWRSVAARGAPTSRWDRALRALASLAWLLPLTVLAIIQPGLRPSLALFALATAVFAVLTVRRARPQPVPPRTFRTLGAWILSGALLTTWVIGLSTVIGISSAAGVVGLLAYLSQGGAPPDLGRATLEELIGLIYRFDALMLALSPVGHALWVGLPLGVGLLLKRRSAAS